MAFRYCMKNEKKKTKRLSGFAVWLTRKFELSHLH